MSNIRFVSIGGPEDKVMHELLCSLSGVEAPTEEWKTKSWQLPVGPRGKEPGRNSSNASVNHWSVAAAVAALHREDRAFDLTELYLSEDNDLWMMECYVGLPIYFALNLLAFTVIRDAAEEDDRFDLAYELSDELYQIHATMLALSTNPNSPKDSFVLLPGPRGGSTVKPDKRARGMMEYLLMFCSGMDENQIRSLPDGRQIMNQVTGNNPDKAASMIHSVAQKISGSLRSDFREVKQCMDTHGLKEMVRRYITKGTRMPFRFRRTTGGVVAVLEKNSNSAKGPKLVDMIKSPEKVPTMWPFGAKKTGGLVEGTANINLETKKVTAVCEGVGSFSAPLPGGEEIFDIRLDRQGVKDLTRPAPPVEPPTNPPTEPPTNPPTEPPAPPAPPKGSKDRRTIVYMCIVGALVIALLVHACS